MKETPRQLRYALRLIHFLQKERGVSVSHYTYTISHPIASSGDRATPLLGIGASLNVESSHSMTGDRFVESKFWSNVLADTRQGTDAAFHMSISYKSEIMAKYSVWTNVLQRVRNKIDSAARNSATAAISPVADNENDTNVSTQDNIISPHQIIVLFNTLIGDIIDEIVTQVIHKEIKWTEKNYGVGKRPDDSKRLRLSSSAQDLIIADQDHSIASDQKQSDYFPKELDVKNHLLDQFQKSVTPSLLARSVPLDRNVFMEKNCSGYQTNTSTVNSPLIHFGSNGAAHPPGLVNSSKRGDDVFSSSKGKKEGGIEIDHHLPSSDRASEEFEDKLEYQVPIHPLTHTATSDPITCHTDVIKQKQKDAERNIKTGNPNLRQIQDLLSLLLSFTQLKESTGIERSIVCSVMALSSKSEECYQTKHTISKLFSDLVVEDEHQRMIVRELQNQSKVLRSTSLSLLQMVEKFLNQGKEMEDVQDMIKTFDLEGLQKYMKVTDFWPIITFYIDQLHALELLIVEELQLSYVVLFLSAKVGDDDTNKASSACIGTTQKREEGGTCVENSPVTPVNSQIISSPSSLHEDGIFNLLQLVTGISKSDAMDEINKMPAVQIKQRILESMQDGDVSGALSSQLQESIDISEEIKNPLIMKESSDNLQEWQIDLYEIEFCQRIGRGVAGTTYLAKWSGQQVAVKVAAITDLGLEGWVTEVHSLKRLHHPNVIRLLGSIYNPSPQTYGLVLEYCNSGDLSESLQYQTPPNFFWKIAKDVANGMSYLHRKSIMHRDIKPANILLDGDVAGGNFCGKVTDFGVAVMHSGQSEEHTAETGTYRWMAPEVIRHESYSFMADVYSYALVVWQLVTHETPFENISQIEAAGKVAIDNARPPFPPGIPNLVMVLIETCWSNCPDDRLSFAQIAVELKKIQDVLKENDKSWLIKPDGHSVYQAQSKKPFPLKGPKAGVGEGKRSTESSPKAMRRGSGSSSKSGKSDDLFSDFLKR